MLTLGGTTDIQYVTNRAEHDRMGRKWTRIMAPYPVLGEHPSTAQKQPRSTWLLLLHLENKVKCLIITHTVILLE